MKKIAVICLSLLCLLVSGCNQEDTAKTSSTPEVMCVTTKSNIYEPGIFTDFYQKIGERLGARDEEFLSPGWQQFYFSSDGTVKYIFSSILSKIPKIEHPENIYRDYLYNEYKLTSDSLMTTRINFRLVSENTGPNEYDPHDIGPDYSLFRKRMSFLDSINIKQLVSEYAVGDPTGYGLCRRISPNFEDDFTKNGIFLDCTNPSDIKQIDCMAFMKSSPYYSQETFEGFAFYYGIFPYYQSDLDGEEMNHLYYDNTDWDNIIILLVRE